MENITAPAVWGRMPFNASILAYRGGKSFIAPRIVALLPPHGRYIEPCLGSGAVFLLKRRAAYEVVNDLDGMVTTFFRVLRDQPSDLIAQLWATPYSRAEFVAALAASEEGSPLETARAFFIRQNQGFAGKAKHPGDWGIDHITARGMPGAASRWQSHILLLAGAAQRLRETMIESQDFAQVIARYVTPDALIYADPPYLPATRKGTDYRHEMTAADHDRLLHVLTTTPAMVALSGYDSPLYREALHGWDCQTFDVPAHSAGRVKGRKGQASPRRVECLWRNPAAMAALGATRPMWEVAS